jgi:ParB/RepB/Spo0J family partition protein
LCQPNQQKSSLPLPSPPQSASEKSSDSARASPSPSTPIGPATTTTPTDPTSQPPSTQTEPSASQTLAPPPQPTNLQQVPLDRILYDGKPNGRFEVDDQHVRELANTIARSGMIHAITFRPKGDYFEVIAGQNRVMAARLLGWREVPGNIQDIDDLAAGTIRLAENVGRCNLTPVEQAVQLMELVEKHPDAVDGVARDVGRSVSWVLDRLDLLEYSRTLLEHIHEKRISLAAAKHLAKIQPKDLQDIRVEQAAHYSIDAKTAAYWLQQTLAEAPPDFDQNEIPLPANLGQVETTTTVVCIRCEQRLDVRQTMPTHICGGCYQQLTNPQPAKPQ